MLSALRYLVIFISLSVGLVFFAEAKSPPSGALAEAQIRHIATYFPGRMTGSSTEMLMASYLQQQFNKWGYHSDIHRFNTRYIYTTKNGQQLRHNATISNVIATHPGQKKQQIIILAHLDTDIPRSDKDGDNNLDGLPLQGVNDNASGLGVMLELAQRLRHVPTRYSLLFIATSGEELGAPGAQNLLSRMSKEEMNNTLLVISLDKLIAGDTLCFSSGHSTPAAVRKLTKDRAIALARKAGIHATSCPESLSNDPMCAGYHRDADVFDNVGIPVLIAETVDASHHLKAGASSLTADNTHNTAMDNITYLDKRFPGRIKTRSHNAVRVLLPLLKMLAKTEKE